VENTHSDTLKAFQQFSCKVKKMKQCWQKREQGQEFFYLFVFVFFKIGEVNAMFAH
jgi:hypothetical protein